MKQAMGLPYIVKNAIGLRAAEIALGSQSHEARLCRGRLQYVLLRMKVVGTWTTK